MAIEWKCTKIKLSPKLFCYNRLFLSCFVLGLTKLDDMKRGEKRRSWERLVDVAVWILPNSCFTIQKTDQSKWGEGDTAGSTMITRKPKRKWKHWGTRPVEFRVASAFTCSNLKETRSQDEGNFLFPPAPGGPHMLHVLHHPALFFLYMPLSYSASGICKYAQLLNKCRIYIAMEERKASDVCLLEQDWKIKIRG